jgi:hypothetical protein
MKRLPKHRIVWKTVDEYHLWVKEQKIKYPQYADEFVDDKWDGVREGFTQKVGVFIEPVKVGDAITILSRDTFNPIRRVVSKEGGFRLNGIICRKRGGVTTWETAPTHFSVDVELSTEPTGE